MHLHTYKNADELSKAVALWITELIEATLKFNDRFTIALSGGSTPQKLHALLAASPCKEQIDWSRLHIFWGDERYVPLSDSRNNAKMAYDTLLDHVAVPKEQVHIMRTDIDPMASATEYEKILRNYFPLTNSQHTFDLVLLGMGDDGHTLSLFPGTKVVHEINKWCTAFFLEQQDMFRITLTKSVVNKSRNIAFLTAGSGKAPALHQVIQGTYAPDTYPSQVIQPEKGDLHWFVDEAAAAEIETKK